jgi:hypothetical protein
MDFINPESAENMLKKVGMKKQMYYYLVYFNEEIVRSFPLFLFKKASITSK